jgi:hypothetical protein
LAEPPDSAKVAGRDWSRREESVRAVLVGIAAALLSGSTGLAQEPLEFTVRPSAIEPGPAGQDGESLDAKLARRERAFRFICVGCARVDGRVATAPFRPIQTLNAPQLNGALTRPEPDESAEPRALE